MCCWPPQTAPCGSGCTRVSCHSRCSASVGRSMSGCPCRPVCSEIGPFYQTVCVANAHVHAAHHVPACCRASPCWPCVQCHAHQIVIGDFPEADARKFIETALPWCGVPPFNETMITDAAWAQIKEVRQGTHGSDGYDIFWLNRMLAQGGLPQHICACWATARHACAVHVGIML